MKKEFEELVKIQSQKSKDIEDDGLQPLDAEGRVLAEHKRFTFDIIDTPVDPLR